MTEERGRLHAEIEKIRIDLESMTQAKQQIQAENSRLLERIGTMEEQSVSILHVPFGTHFIFCSLVSCKHYIHVITQYNSSEMFSLYLVLLLICDLTLFLSSLLTGLHLHIKGFL